MDGDDVIFRGRMGEYTRTGITIGRDGLVWLTEAACDRLGWPDHVVWLFNLKERRISLRAAQPEDRSYLYRLSSKRNRKDGRTVSGRALLSMLRREGIIVTPGRYTASVFAGRLIIDLDMVG